MCEGAQCPRAHTRTGVCFWVGHGHISADVFARMDRFTPFLLLHPNSPSCLPLECRAPCKVSLKGFETHCPGPAGIPQVLTSQAQLRAGLGRPLVATLGKSTSARLPAVPKQGPCPALAGCSLPKDLSSGTQGFQSTPKPSNIHPHGALGAELSAKVKDNKYK